MPQSAFRRLIIEKSNEVRGLQFDTQLDEFSIRRERAEKFKIYGRINPMKCSDGERGGNRHVCSYVGDDVVPNVHVPHSSPLARVTGNGE